MAKSIVISKIRCASPNRKNTAVQTLNHLKYIATRPGVDLTPIKTSAGDDASIYLKYISERPRSHGLFGNLSNKKIGDLDALCKEMYQLSKQKVIYKGIVSLNEEDATRLGYTNKDSWNSLLNVAMPDIAHEFNIPIQNMSWVAAFHQEQGHPHIHYMLWRNDDKIASPFIHKSVQNRCRQIFSKYIFEADRELSVAIKTAARNELLDMSKELVGYPELSLESEGVLKITPKELSEVSALLFNLHPLLPTGRLNYKFLPPEVKKEVDSIIEHILSYPAFESKYCEYVEACKKISASYSVVGKKAEHNLFSAEKELRTRLANIILKKVKTIPADALMPDKNNMEDTGDGDIAIESMTQQRIGTQRARRHYDYSEIITPQPSDSHLTFLVNAEEPLEPDVHVHEEIGGNHKKSSSRGASKEYPYWTASYKLAKKALYSEEKKSPEQVADILALLEAEAQEKNPIEFELNKEHFALYKLANLHHYTQPEPPIDVEKLVTKLQKIYASEDDKQKEQAAYHLGLIHLKEGDFFDPSLAVKYLKEISKNSNNYSALFQLVKLHLYQPEKAEDITPDYLMTSLNKLVQDDVTIKQRNQALYYLALLHLQDDSELFNPLIANQYLWEAATTGNTEERNYTALFQIAKLQLYKKEPAVIVTETHRLLSELELLHEKSTDIILRYRAAYYLGLLYLQEESEQYNKAIGIEYLWLVAEAGIGSESASALFRLAKIQLREESDKSLIEPNKLIVALKRLNENPTEAEQSLNYHCRSAYYLGLLYLQEQSKHYSIADGINYLWLAAKAEVGSESAFALFQLAKLHLKEDNETSSIEPDKLIVALKRLHENPSEAERNLNFHDQAAYYLGLLHLKEDSVLYDKALGIQYLWLAAESDNDSQSAFALFQLAKLRLKDDKNIESSFIDRNKLIVCLNTLYESPIAENEQNLHHHAQAAYYLGLFYLQEGSALYSPLKAIQYLWEASGDGLSEQSNPFALFKLVQLYLYSEDNAIVTNINSDKLVALLNTLSNKAEEDELRMQALYLTALLHLKTDSKHYNIDIALSLLNPLADNGYTSAQASLGSFYLWGKHGRRDIKQGKMWLEKAAEQDYEPAKNQLEMYKNILQNKLIYSSYKLLNSMYTNLVFSSQNKQAYATERATESIKLQKERFRKNQIRSSYLE